MTAPREVAWDTVRAVVLLDGEPAPADVVFEALTNCSISGLRVESIRWTLGCCIELRRGAAKARLNFVARRGRLEVPVPTEHRFICDHIATGGRWFPIDAPAAQAAAEAVSQSDPDLIVSAAFALECGIAMRDSGIDVSVTTLDNFEPSLDEIDTSWDESFSQGTKLFAYQESGVKWLHARHSAGMGALLADEMGLGKTLQAIAWVAADIRDGGQVLIVTPASLTENWRRELMKFAGLSPFAYIGKALATTPAALACEPLVLTTYDTVRQHQLILEQFKWTSLIVDEAQYIKNRNSGRSMAIKALPRDRALAITGTPVENRLSEVVSILELVAPKVFEPFIRLNDQQLEAAWDINVRPFMSSLMLRREVNEVRKDLPPKVMISTPLVPSIYYQKEQATLLRQAEKASYSDRLALITRLRRLSGSEPVEGSGKGEFLDGVVSNLKSSKGKALIFASYTDSIEALQAYAASREIDCWKITGSTPPSARQEIVDLFSRHLGEALLVLNLKAGGVGLNITAANVVIHWESDWNPAVTDQATARAYRTGQEQTVFVYELFYAGSIEEYIVERQVEKRRLAEDAVQPMEVPLSSAAIDRMFVWLKNGVVK